MMLTAALATTIQISSRGAMELSSDDRPYRHHSEAELLRLLSQYDSFSEETQQEQQDFVRRAGPAAWVYQSEDYRGFNDRLRQINDWRRGVQAELAARRTERAGTDSGPMAQEPARVPSAHLLAALSRYSQAQRDDNAAQAALRVALAAVPATTAQSARLAEQAMRGLTAIAKATEGIAKLDRTAMTLEQQAHAAWRLAEDAMVTGIDMVRRAAEAASPTGAPQSAAANPNLRREREIRNVAARARAEWRRACSERFRGYALDARTAAKLARDQADEAWKQFSGLTSLFKDTSLAARDEMEWRAAIRENERRYLVYKTKLDQANELVAQTWVEVDRLAQDSSPQTNRASVSRRIAAARARADDNETEYRLRLERLNDDLAALFTAAAEQQLEQERRRAAVTSRAAAAALEALREARQHEDDE